MKLKIITLLCFVLMLNACAASRVQTETGAMSIDQGKFFSNASLVYSKAHIGQCDIPSATQIETGGLSVPLEPMETEIVCSKNGGETVQRVLTPLLWKTKYDKSRSAALASSFLFAGPLALAMSAAMTPSQTTAEDVAAFMRTYPPYIAVVRKNAPASEKQKVKASLNKKYADYYNNLPADCDNWNQREHNALCLEQMIELLKEHEHAYIDGRDFVMPEKLVDPNAEETPKERTAPND